MTNSADNFEIRLLGSVPRLKKLAFALTASKADSEDLVQSTLERALSRQQQCRNLDKVENWSLTILRSIWKNEVRSRFVRRGNGHVDSNKLTESSRQEHKYEVNRLRTAVNELPEQYRSAVILIDVYGMSYKEASDLLEVEIGTIKSRLARGRQRLIESEFSNSEPAQSEIRP